MSAFAKKYLPWILVLILLVSTSATGVLLYQAWNRPPQQSLPLRVGFASPDITDIPREYATYVILPKMGIAPQVFYVESDPTLVAALLAGDIDIGIMGVSSVLASIDQGSALKVIGVNMAQSDYMLVSTKQITSLKDLVDKKGKIGISSAGGESDVLARLLFEKNGLDTTKLEWISVGGSSARLSAIVAGRVDAALLHVDAALQAQGQGLNILKTLSDDLPKMWFNVILSSEAFIKTNPYIVASFVKASIMANRWAYDNRQDFLARAALTLPDLKPDYIAQVYDMFLKMKVWDPNGGLDRQSYQTLIGIQVRLGAVKTAIPFETAVTTEFQDAALKELGTR